MEQELEYNQILCKDNRIVIKIPIEQKIKFIKGMKKFNMTQSQFLIYLLEEYEGANLKVLKNFRIRLKERIKKGINYLYLRELVSIKNIIDKL